MLDPTTGRQALINTLPYFSRPGASVDRLSSDDDLKFVFFFSLRFMCLF